MSSPKDAALRCGGREPSKIRGTAWYARRQAGPDMITTSPDRKSIAIGSVSLVNPPIKKMAALPRLFKNTDGKIQSRTSQLEVISYEIEIRGDVAQISERST